MGGWERAHHDQACIDDTTGFILAEGLRPELGPFDLKVEIGD